MQPSHDPRRITSKLVTSIVTAALGSTFRGATIGTLDSATGAVDLNARGRAVMARPPIVRLGSDRQPLRWTKGGGR